MIIRHLEPADWTAVEAIYRQGINTGHATFEAHTPSWSQFDRDRRDDLRLVAEEAGAIVGWVAASSMSARSVYAGVVEHSVYVAEAARGRGVARRLLTGFVELTEKAGVWTIQSSVFPENEPSLALHESVGFRIVGRRERIGLMPTGPCAGQWRDTLLIERRRR